ncbi:MAG: hypothetical protein IPK31_01435 [Chitinophagaceae bacterium]|nr:hypothetical protein [Chitinophagaceae bacterium]
MLQNLYRLHFKQQGADTWSAYDIIGHLIHGEKTDWIPRMEIILSGNRIKHLNPLTALHNLKTAGKITGAAFR